ncbi:lipocalin family protein [Chryseobacterium oryctis]|uniref:Lipocalin family protein n=1 Tax=Chryseobacterium oryctis TaxID=2952618 RepID=A0ABT3HKZ3_9FLAO|nr:lipocalin family protein [Chryseobacterium oryctis]MCW3160345.1 lipocalin family protein [Chryseobacterium oryctis]
MKNSISLILLCLLMMNCQPQQKGRNLNTEMQTENNPEYFLGSWKFVEKIYIEEGQEKSYPLQECMKKYTWIFEKQNEDFFLTKNYATGKDCSVKSSSGKTYILINGSSILYTDGDLKRKEDFVMISKNKFSINYKDILNRKVVQIKDIYERQ